MLSLPWIGANAWVTYLEKIPYFITKPSLSATAYQTIHSFIYHLTYFHQYWNPYPLFDFPIIGFWVSKIIILSILVTSCYLAFSLKDKNLQISFFILTGIVISPVSTDTHYILVLIPIFILIKYLKNNPTILFRIILLISILLISLNLPYSSRKLYGEIWAFFVYPKLFGALSLWFLSILISLKSKKEIQTLV